MAYSIRPANAPDEPSLQVVRQQAMEASLSGRYPQRAVADRVAPRNDHLSAWIDADDTLVLVVETEVTVMGFGAYAVGEGRVLALYTAPDYQDQGCASTVLERFERRARDDGRDQLRARVPETAVEFFEARGFDRSRTVERDGISIVVVKKELT